MAESNEQQANDIHDDYSVVYVENDGASCSNVQCNGDYVVSDNDDESATETESETGTESTGSTNNNNKRSLWSIDEEDEVVENNTKSIMNGVAELEPEKPGTSDFSPSSTSGFCSTFHSNSEAEEVRQMLSDLTVEGSLIDIIDDSEVSESDNDRENIEREFNELYNFTMVTDFFENCLAEEVNVVNEPNADNANNNGNEDYDERFHFIDSSELYYSDASDDSGTTISTDESDASD